MYLNLDRVFIKQIKHVPMHKSIVFQIEKIRETHQTAIVTVPNLSVEIGGIKKLLLCCNLKKKPNIFFISSNIC